MFESEKEETIHIQYAIINKNWYIKSEFVSDKHIKLATVVHSNKKHFKKHSSKQFQT